MKNKYLLYSFFLILIVTNVQSQSFWKEINNKDIPHQKLLERERIPLIAKYFKLDYNKIEASLNRVYNKNNPKHNPSIILKLPTIDGYLIDFKIFEATNMTQDLQNKFPEIRAFKGYSVDEPEKIIRFSFSPEKGFSSMQFSNNKTIFIEPYTNDLRTYIVFVTSVNDKLNNSFECLTEDLSSQENDFSSLSFENANDGTLRTFRLALACTGEYATYHGGTLSSVMAAMNTTMTRVNGVYENELSVTMVMVDNTSIIFLNGSTDPYTNSNGFAMLSENQTTVDSNIGSANYDIGHVFSTGGGGVASLNSPCTGAKARGVTGLTNPIGDVFDIDYVAHEMGHQFGSTHTFNGNSANCSGGNRTAATAYEPGSGSTIMAYAGICAPQNVQNNSDDYFHQESLRIIWNNITIGSSTCATQSATNNTAPTAEAGPSFTIPISTPYKLVGSSTDIDGTSNHTFTWEQYDLGSSGVPTETTLTGPLVRSFKGTSNNTRFIPRLSDLITSGGSTTWEKLVSISRDINFRLTVRDNDIRGGQTAVDNMIVTTTTSAGPFLVTSQSTNEIWETADTQTITWNVAGTDSGIVNTPNVNILLSIDGGLTYPFTLANNVANDGSHDIVVPTIGTDTTTARIMVEGNGNIFFAINTINFTINQSSFALNVTNTEANVCSPNDQDIDFIYNTFIGFSDPTTFSATGLPAGASATFSPVTATADGTNITATITGTGSLSVGSYTFTFTGTSGGIVRSSQNVTLNVFDSSLVASTLSTPANGAINVPIDTSLTWNLDSNALSYLVEIATDLGFSNIIESNSVTTNSYLPTNIDIDTTYYWRVTASNSCVTAASSSVFNYTVENKSCNDFSATDLPQTISNTGTPTLTSIINVTEDFNILDVDVTVNIRHTFISDIDMTLTSPDGTVVELSTDNGASGDDYTNTVFDQEGSTPITSGAPPFTGTFLPEGDLSTLYGETSGGDWTLTVTDDSNFTGGTFEGFDLYLCVEGLLGAEEINLSATDFIIFPNPNSGTFTIKSNSLSASNPILVSVYDIRGRKISEKQFNNPVSNFEETIYLNQIQSGMYLVNIVSNNSSLTKRIIVK